MSHPPTAVEEQMQILFILNEAFLLPADIVVVPTLGSKMQLCLFLITFLYIVSQCFLYIVLYIVSQSHIKLITF